MYFGYRFVQLIGMSHSHSTLLVCADSERNAEEIEVLCNDACKREVLC